ncbi:hypothetical protein [Variovorax sp. efr-133-TYG-130]|uniref:hypothetical protein n=1 Tax=Variovorax sp. efr-133-TYG-130 TaxID=3040327 RepID=UPI0025567E19|nr:hypothetical protein [Variovorax sp. efr-133-TYG-130]
MNLLFQRMALAAGALCIGMACGAAHAASQARVVSSTWLPGGKYALVYEFEGAEYMTVTADPPGAWISVAQPERDPKRDPEPVAQTPAPTVARAEAFPESASYVGGFFIDPLAAALRATGLGLLLNGDWPHGPRRFSR